MKYTFLTSLFAGLALMTQAQQAQNPLLDGGFWKNKPTIATIQQEINNGVNLQEQAPNLNDGIVMAINNGASMETLKFMLEQPNINIDTPTHHLRTYLNWAAMRGYKELIQYLVERKSNINYKDSHGTTPLHSLAAAGNTDFELYEYMIKHGADIHIKNNSGANLLMLAAQKDQDGTLVAYLIEKGFKLTDKDANGNNLFYYAARGGNIAMMKYLASKGITHDKNVLLALGGGGRGPAHDISVFEYVANLKGVDIHAKDAQGNNIVNLLAKRAGQAKVIQYFLAKGVKPQIIDQEGNTIFMNAVNANDMEMATLFYPMIKDINHKNNLGLSAVTMAVKGGSPELLQYLLDKGGDVQVEDASGNNLNYYIIQAYNPRSKDVVTKKMNLLNQKGFDFSKLSSNGNSMLYYAVATNNIATIKKALELDKQHINTLNHEGNAPIHKAALLARNTEVLKLLVAHGASKTTKTEFEETAYELAESNDYLKQKNIDISFLKS